MNTTQWFVFCSFTAWTSFRIGVNYAFIIATRMVKEQQESQLANLNELSAKIDSCRNIRDECDRIRFQQQTRANSN